MIDTGKLMAFEQGEMSFDEAIELFQELVDSGLAWELQGTYGRTAKWAIEQGYVTPAPVVAATEPLFRLHHDQVVAAGENFDQAWSDQRDLADRKMRS